MVGRWIVDPPLQRGHAVGIERYLVTAGTGRRQLSQDGGCKVPFCFFIQPVAEYKYAFFKIPNSLEGRNLDVQLNPQLREFRTRVDALLMGVGRP